MTGFIWGRGWCYLFLFLFRILFNSAAEGERSDLRSTRSIHPFPPHPQHPLRGPPGGDHRGTGRRTLNQAGLGASCQRPQKPEIAPHRCDVWTRLHQQNNRCSFKKKMGGGKANLALRPAAGRYCLIICTHTHGHAHTHAQEGLKYKCRPAWSAPLWLFVCAESAPAAAAVCCRCSAELLLWNAGLHPGHTPKPLYLHCVTFNVVFCCLCIMGCMVSKSYKAEFIL